MYFNKVLLAAVVVTCICACDSATLGSVSNALGAQPLISSATPGGAEDCGEVNLHTIASATSSVSHDNNYSPERAIDNALDDESRWSSLGYNQPLVLDLGAVKEVGRVYTSWYKSDVRDAYFDVDTSVNGETWNSVLTDAVAGGSSGFIGFDVTSSTARFVRITGRGNSESAWNSLIEVAVGDSCDNTKETPLPIPPVECTVHDNLLITTATSSYSHDADYNPSRAIDNDLGTESRWSSNGMGNSITLDLGSIATVRRIATAWYKADERQVFFDVETSTDASSWVNVLLQATAQGSEGFINFDLNESQARYVRIVGFGNSASLWNSLIEVDVFGCGTQDNTQGPGGETIDEPIDETTPENPSDSIALIKELFTLEGGDDELSPYMSNNVMQFDALEAQHVTPNGNGWRHEMKMATTNRRAMDETTESLSATVTPELSDGSKTIVVQYHASGTGTIVKVYVSDTNESDHEDSIPGNGIFDVYVRMLPQGADSEEVIDFGTIESGESFDLTIINERGFVTVEAMGVSRNMRVDDSDAAYLKFGNYLQAQDPFSGEKFSSDS